MRFGSSRGPLRATVAGMSLAGLGTAILLPNLAAPTVDAIDADPIITQSIDKGVVGAPTLTDLPPVLGAAGADDIGADGASEGLPRQVLPSSSSTVDIMMQAASQDDPVVRPVMTDAADMDAAETAETEDPASPIEVAASPDPTAGSGAPARSETASGDAQGVSGMNGIGEGAGHSAVVLALDHARVMRLTGNVSTIIIGNPAIADASMPDPQTLVLTGKSYGETNMVMLNEAGSIVGEQILRVTVRGQSLVSVYRGVSRTTLSCSPTCEIRPTPGDTPETIAAGMSAFEQRNTAALEAVGQQ